MEGRSVNRWELAVTAMIGISALGFLAADGERRRVGYVRAMRRSLVRMADLIRYEQPPLDALLMRVELRATLQERELTRLLHACAGAVRGGEIPQLAQIFSVESARTPGCGRLNAADRAAYEAILAELGRLGLDEQLRLIDEADERLRQREEQLRRETGRRAQLIRALSMTGGAAAFLLLI